MRSNLTPASAACGNGIAGPEAIYEFTASVAGTYLVRETSNANVSLWASSGTCGGASCLATSGTTRSLALTLAAGQRAYVVVEDLSTWGTSPTATLVVTREP